jgi:hypothetical protein
MVDITRKLRTLNEIRKHQWFVFGGSSDTDFKSLTKIYKQWTA